MLSNDPRQDTPPDNYASYPEDVRRFMEGKDSYWTFFSDIRAWRADIIGGEKPNRAVTTHHITEEMLLYGIAMPQFIMSEHTKAITALPK